MYRQKSCPYMKACVGKPAPTFCAEAISDLDFTTVSLSDFSGKYLVILFYPNDFSLICPKELTSFSDRIAEFDAIDCAILAISTDSKFSHFAWASQSREDGGISDIKFPICADKSQTIAREYGVLKEDEGVAYRGLFIIDDVSVVRHMSINDFQVTRSVEETLRIVQALQQSNKCGTVSSADGKPAKERIKTGKKIKKSKENSVKQ